jgi:hypothetical protein
MDMEKNEQLIGEIMLDYLPKDILRALQVMASLTYPINDRRSFLAQLETLVRDSQKSTSVEQEETVHLVRGVITVFDFPTSTPASGLEKAYAHLSKPFWEDLGLDLDTLDPGEFIERPTIDHCSELMNKFPGVCGRRACEAYYQLVRDFGEVPARIAAEAIGRSCR